MALQITRTLAAGLLLPLSFALLACTDTPVTPLDAAEPLAIAPAGAASHADVFLLDGGDVVGRATLVRRSDAVSLSLHASGLVAGDAVTMWWVVFQNPTACSAPGCGANDLFAAGVDGGLFRADGQVVGGDGRAGFTSKLEVGTESLAGLNAFTEPEGSEIHIVLQTHGQAEADREALEEQLSGFQTGCNPDCADTHAAVFPAP